MKGRAEGPGVSQRPSPRRRAPQDGAEVALMGNDNDRPPRRVRTEGRTPGAEGSAGMHVARRIDALVCVVAPEK
jgi:hypothetical protein